MAFKHSSPIPLGASPAKNRPVGVLHQRLPLLTAQGCQQVFKAGGLHLAEMVARCLFIIYIYIFIYVYMCVCIYICIHTYVCMYCELVTEAPWSQATTNVTCSRGRAAWFSWVLHHQCKRQLATAVKVTCQCLWLTARCDPARHFS